MSAKRFSIVSISTWMIAIGGVILAALLGMVCIAINAQLAFLYFVGWGFFGAGILLRQLAQQVEREQEKLTR